MTTMLFMVKGAWLMIAGFIKKGYILTVAYE
jgi:hypothetical protein